MITVPLSARDRTLKGLDWPEKPLIDMICLYCGIADRMRCSWFCSGFCEDSYVLDEASQLNLCEMVA